MTKESGIIELETLVPMFIKGKDPDYGEGIYTFGDKAYLLDNDKLYKFIYERTYDENGMFRVEGRDYVEWYAEFMKLGRNENELVNSYNTFAQLAGITPRSVSDKREIREKEKFKKKSVQYFLDKLNLLGLDKENVIKRLSRGVTTLRSSEGQKKFIQNGRGECFLPGSSIKGAFRNALLWKMLGAKKSLHSAFQDYVTENLSVAEAKDERGQRKFAEKFSKHPNSSGVSLDAITFSRCFPEANDRMTSYGKTYRENYNKHWQDASAIHRDLFRIVNITDAKFVGRANWQNAKVKTYKLNGERFQPRDRTDIELEAVGKGSRARFRITIDKGMAEEFFCGRIPPYLQSVDALLQTVNEFFTAVAAAERGFYKKATQPGCINDVKQWYDELLTSERGDDGEKSMLFRLGWGGGMMSKTQFLYLSEPDRIRVRNLINDRGVTVAPQSRCLLTDEDRAFLPLGWCRLRYLGKNDAETAAVDAVAQKSIPPPRGCVRATIVNDQIKPPQIRIEDGDYKESEIHMSGISNLSALSLQTGSIVFVELITQKGRKGKRQLISALYKDKPFL